MNLIAALPWVDLTDRDFSDCAMPYAYLYKRDLTGCKNLWWGLVFHILIIILKCKIIFLIWGMVIKFMLKSGFKNNLLE